MEIGDVLCVVHTWEQLADLSGERREARSERAHQIVVHIQEIQEAVMQHEGGFAFDKLRDDAS